MRLLNPSQGRPRLAESLASLAECAYEAEDFRRAYNSGLETVSAYRDLARANQCFRLPLARALYRLGEAGQRLRELGDLSGRSPEYGSEGVMLLASEHQDADSEEAKADMARVYHSISTEMLSLHRPSEAIKSATKAVGAYRKLTDSDRDRYRARLASSLVLLASCYTAVGKAGHAILPAEEAAGIYRQLIFLNPKKHRIPLADALLYQGMSFAGVDQLERALGPLKESIAVYRDYGSRTQQNYLLGLLTISTVYIELRSYEEGLPFIEENVSLERGLHQADINPERHGPGLASALTANAMFLVRSGRPEEALVPAEEAVALRRQFAGFSTVGLYESALSGALEMYAEILLACERFRDAEESLREAHSILSRLDHQSLEPRHEEGRERLLRKLGSLHLGRDS